MINGEFMKKYKENYNYQQIINIIQTDENIKIAFNKNKKQILNLIKQNENYEAYITSIIQQFKNEFILELGKKRKNQNDLKSNLTNNNLIKYKKAKIKGRNGAFLLYFEGLEILNSEFIELFKKIEEKQINQLLITQEINCLLGEKKIFINILNSQYFYLNICHFSNNNLESDLLVYFFNNQDLDKFISKIKAMSFDKFIQPHLKDIQEKNNSFISDNKGLKI